MSYIVDALSKTKGQPEPAPKKASPRMRPVSATPSELSLKAYASIKEAATAKEVVAKKRLPWVPLLATLFLAGVVSAGGWWFAHRPAAPAALPAPVHESAVKPAEHLAAEPAATALAPDPSGPSTALAEKIRVLAISAAVPGDSPRMVVDNKVFLPGDKVIDGLSLQEIYPGLIVFRDDNGNLYDRRF